MSNGKMIKFIPKVVKPEHIRHYCMPPMEKECQADNGSIWQCDCGQQWKCIGRKYYGRYTGYNHPLWKKMRK